MIQRQNYRYNGGDPVERGDNYELRHGYADGSYTRALAYNGQGLLASERVSIGGAPQSYTTTYQYDAYSRPVTTTYPGGEAVAVSGFTGRGLPTGLQGGGGSLVDEVAYDAAGRPLRQRYPADGNVQRLWSYAPFNQQDNNGGMLTSIVVEKAAVPAALRLLSFDYGYDSFGNLKGQSDTGAPWVSFTYDAQNRLTNAYDRTYTYDAAGRLTSYEGSSRSYTGADPVHAVKNSGYGYDANGNLLQRPGLALVWNVENRLASATVNGAGVESYGYNDAGIRVKKGERKHNDLLPLPPLRGAGERHQRNHDDEVLLLRRSAHRHAAGGRAARLPPRRPLELDGAGDARRGAQWAGALLRLRQGPPGHCHRAHRQPLHRAEGGCQRPGLHERPLL